MIKPQDAPQSLSLTSYQKTFKNITLITLFTNIPYLAALIIGIFAPLKDGGGSFLLFIPIIFIGWCYAVVYLFYFPYYIIRYKQSGVFTKIGTGVFTTIVLVGVGMVGYILYLSSR